MNKKEIAQKIIPLPRKLKCSEGVEYNPSRIRVEILGEMTPALDTAKKLMEKFSDPSQLPADFIITLKYINEKDNPKLSKKLKKAKNREQAYVIQSKVKKGVYEGIELAAYTDVGLLYAALTLRQAVEFKKESVTIPILKIADWPEIPYRGQWGGNSNCDLYWTYQYKLNALDGKVYVTADEEGRPTVTHNERLYRDAESFGVDVMATIPHLEQISRRGFLEKRTDILNVPSEERKNRSDYFPGICMSKKASEDMIFEWFTGIAENRHVKKILVWLSEEATPCYCEQCKGAEPYQLEAACLLRAYGRLKEKKPGIKLGIMLSQGSFEVTGKIAEMVLEKGVDLTYYDGGRTYDSGKYPMILPELEEYSKKGGNLGVYPQITHSWRMVFPWTAPAFIKYRCDEFAQKNLHRAIGYAVPSNRYHEFNVMAFAEWLWNPKGRKKSEFAQVYAYNTGLPEKEFSDFVKLMEKPAWQLAQSKLLLRLCYNYPLILRGRADIEDHRFEMAELIPIKNPEKLMRKAEEAESLAASAGLKLQKYEAGCVKAGLMAYTCVTDFLAELEKQSIDTQMLTDRFVQLKTAAETMRKSIIKWSKGILPESETPMYRVVDTSMILYRALDGFKRYFDRTGVRLEAMTETVEPVGEWDEGSMDEKGNAVLEFDITEYVVQNREGRYYVSLDFIESDSGSDINCIYVIERQRAGGQKTAAYCKAEYKRLSVWAPWAEYPLKLKNINPMSGYHLAIDMTGAPKGKGTCRGLAGIRKV